MPYILCLVFTRTHNSTKEHKDDKIAAVILLGVFAFEHRSSLSKDNAKLVAMALMDVVKSDTARRLCPPIRPRLWPIITVGACTAPSSPYTPKAVTYHYCRCMIGHSLGRVDISCFVTTFPFI